ncbi:hypothetical protein [Aeromicrobium wangtongii]|uniref:hypothetical protein n=1 Tax=Aeromicrobium wangtongii TaxID=2969247 RepID=UPI002016C3B1|nr:hypothetical protein [Aeromicrobium wangtongii]MCL3819606.1 hypothetical protein [Aeromicrobium wangtongii]
MTTTIVDATSVPWVNGADVYMSMEPAFRNNLGGPLERVEELLSRYSMRTLWIDPGTTRRIDHVRTDPGYVDLCEAYHDSVEECFFLSGSVELTAEGDFQAGDYFWRPPGWVHMARSPEGFEGILMMEGESPSDGSGRVSRVIRPDSDAGCNPIREGEQSIGPRGYVRRAEARHMVWRRHDDSVTALGSAELTSKVLSSNAVTAAASVLVAVPAGCSTQIAPSDRERFLISTTGTITVDGHDLEPCSLIHVPPGAAAPTLSTDDGAELLVKVGAAA